MSRGLFSERLKPQFTFGNEKKLKKNRVSRYHHKVVRLGRTKNYTLWHLSGETSFKKAQKIWKDCKLRRNRSTTQLSFPQPIGTSE
jgi:hypothetical protein